MRSRLVDMIEELEPKIAKTMALAMKPLVLELNAMIEKTATPQEPLDLGPITILLGITASNIENYSQQVLQDIKLYGERQVVYNGVMVSQIMLAMIAASAIKTLCQLKAVENDMETLRSIAKASNGSSHESPPPDTSSGG